MAHRELELTLLSARDLKSVNLFTRMDVYAVASISGDPMTRQCTPTDTSGGRNPSWNATLRFSIPPSAAAATASGGGWLHVLLRSERALGDRDIGEVVIPIAELLAGADGTGPQPPRLVSYQVHTMQRGEPRGVLNVSYRLGPIVAPVATVGYPVPQQPFKPQNTAAPQQHYQYYDGYAPAQKPIKPQNPVPQQQPYQYNPEHDGYAAPQQPYKPQNQAPLQQPYQYHDAYASPQRFKHQNPASPQPYKPQNQAPPQQPYQYHDAYASPQRFKPQNPVSPQPYHSPRDTYAAPPKKPYHPPRESYAPPSRHEETAALSPANGSSNGYGPTNYYMGPHTQIILGSGVSAATTPARSNTMPAKTDDGPVRPKPTYTPTQPITSPAKADHSWPKAASPQRPHKDTTKTWPNASPKKPDHSTQPQHDTKNPAPAHQPITKTDHPSWPQASPQRSQESAAWPKASPTKPNDSSTTRPQQPDTKVVERVHTQTKVGSGKPQAVEQQKNTQVSVTKTNGTTQSSLQPGKADSTRPKEAYANTRSNSTPAKADHHQPANKAVLQHERVHSLPTAAR